MASFNESGSDCAQRACVCSFHSGSAHVRPLARSNRIESARRVEPLAASELHAEQDELLEAAWAEGFKLLPFVVCPNGNPTDGEEMDKRYTC